LAPDDGQPLPAPLPDISALYVNPDDYEEVSTIGTGGYGTVIKARHRPTGLIVAMKRLFRVDERHSDREVQNAASFSHPTILRVIGCSPFCHQPIILLPFLEGVRCNRR
jgi:serine/threonine protein kinase